MSWQEMNHYELAAMRQLLMLSVTEAAEEIGQCSTRAWQHWETGRNRIPEDVEIEIYGLIGNRNRIIAEMLDYKIDESIRLKYFKTHAAFHEQYKKDVINFRLYQSVAAYLFAEGGEIELDEAAKIDEESYLHLFFSSSL